MSITPKSLEEFVVTRKQKPGNVTEMDYETPINVEGELPLSPEQMSQYAKELGEPYTPPTLEPQPTPSVVETEEAIDQVVRQPANSGDSNLWYFLPAALGALTGMGQEGANASYLAIEEARKRQEKKDDYNRALEAKIKEMQMRRNLFTGKSREPKLVLIDQDGNPIYQTSQGAVGKKAYIKPSAQGQTLEEKIALYEATRGKRADQGLNLKKQQIESAEARNVRKDFLSDKQVAPTLTALDTIGELEVALDTPGWAGAVTAQAKFIRGVLKEVGNLNQQEQDRASVSPSWINKTDQFFSKIADGDPLTATDRKELKDMMRRMRAAYNIILEKKLTAYVKSIKDSTGKDVSKVIRPFVPKEQSKKKYENLSDEELDKRLRGEL